VELHSVRSWKAWTVDRVSAARGGNRFLTASAKKNLILTRRKPGLRVI